jgi:CheY-like chemotaxis protein
MLICVPHSTMDGFEYARQIRIDETQKNIPLIVISARTDDATKQKALSSGFDKIFSKPIKFVDIRVVMPKANE